MAELTQELIAQEGQALLRAEQSKAVLRPFTEKYPGISQDEAYRIQLAFIELKKSAGAKVVGKKIGLTSKAMQKMLNVDQPDYGHILDGMVLQDGAQFRVAELIQPKIEPEIAFIMDRDLKGPGVTPMQVMAATRFVVPALEIIDSRIEGWKIKLCDTIADNAADAGVILGGEKVKPADVDMRWIGAIFSCNGVVEETGLAAGVLGHPANGIAWVARRIAPYGLAIEPGQIILAGSFTRASATRPGDQFVADYGPLGTVLSELFPTSVRYTGSSLTFNMAGIFGASLAPYIATYLAGRYGLQYVGYYLTAAAALTLVGLLAIRETKDEELD